MCSGVASSTRFLRTVALWVVEDTRTTTMERMLASDVMVKGSRKRRTRCRSVCGCSEDWTSRWRMCAAG